jgi:Ca2+/H+ antiporter, TMEM165/GDT1 family
LNIFVSVTLLTFWTVLAMELVGDRSLYTITSLSLRLRPGPLFAGITAAFATKMLAAVLLAHLLVRLNSRWTNLVSAIAFFFSAIFLWFEEPESSNYSTKVPVSWWHSASLGFVAILFAEWGDPSQIAVAALAGKFQLLTAAWLGGTFAMAAKGLLAITFGSRLRAYIPQTALRALGTVSCCLLGILALLGFMFR